MLRRLHDDDGLLAGKDLDMVDADIVVSQPLVDCDQCRALLLEVGKDVVTQRSRVRDTRYFKGSILHCPTVLQDDGFCVGQDQQLADLLHLG